MKQLAFTFLIALTVFIGAVRGRSFDILRNIFKSPSSPKGALIGEDCPRLQA